MENVKLVNGQTQSETRLTLKNGVSSLLSAGSGDLGKVTDHTREWIRSLMLSLQASGFFCVKMRTVFLDSVNTQPS